jgi:hypothetical protein
MRMLHASRQKNQIVQMVNIDCQTFIVFCFAYKKTFKTPKVVHRRRTDNTKQEH